MTKEMMFAKIHRATVTECNLNYEGSITIDYEILKKANILEYQKVDVLNINNGERFETYVIKGTSGSKQFCINGAGARKAQIGDKIIIIAYATLLDEEIKKHKPYLVFLDKNNDEIIQKA